MSEIWKIVATWNGFSQGLFLFLVVLVFISGFEALMHNANILIHGWPPPEYYEAMGETPDDEEES